MFNKMGIPMRCRKFEARLEDYLAGASDSELHEHLAPVRGLPRGAGRFAAGGKLDPTGVGTGQRTAPGVSGRRHGENSRGKIARGIASGVLEPARIPGVAIVADGGDAAARSVRLSWWGLRRTERHATSSNSNRTECQRFSAAARGPGEQRRGVAIAGREDLWTLAKAIARQSCSFFWSLCWASRWAPWEPMW